MSHSELAAKQCVPCRGGVPPLAGAALDQLATLIPAWRVVDGHHLDRELSFPDFATALAAANRIGALADEQGHHPDLHVSWGKLGIRVWTHKVDGLTESDFVLAAKIDAIV